MSKKIMQLVAILLAVTLCVPTAWGTQTTQEKTIRVGLAYGGNAFGARAMTRLKNDPGYGAGFRFGYFDDKLAFVELGRTQAKEMELAILKATEFYLVGNSYESERPTGSYQTIGCYHVVLPGSYDSFEQARSAADGVSGGFVAWIKDSYQVRAGAYTTADEARAAANAMGSGYDVKGTSRFGINILAANTAQIIFQFDADAQQTLGIRADVTGAPKVHTAWRVPNSNTSYYRYYGDFRFERIDGGDMTIVNLVQVEDYVKGVIPYEMANGWPIEALKAQAVCARGYVLRNLNKTKHRPYHFDVCDTADCQRYIGLGPYNRPTYSASEATDRAVDETRGEVLWYGNTVAETYYSSSMGGATEEVANVWTNNKVGDFPYLCGVLDPYEIGVADRNSNSSWTVNYTAAELTRRLQSNTYGIGTSVDRMELTYSKLGNVIKLVVFWSNGQSNTFKPTSIRGLFGVNSIRFTVNGQTVKPDSVAPAQGYPINAGDTLPTTQESYTISGTGEISKVEGALYAISGSGAVDALKKPDQSAGDNQGGGTVTVSGKAYTFNGSGWGHQIGMSQYGANAMARQGFTYREIVEFYYPGTNVGIFTN